MKLFFYFYPRKKLTINAQIWLFMSYSLFRMLQLNWPYMEKQRTLKGIRLRSQVSVQAKWSWATKWFPVIKPINQSNVDGCEHWDSISVSWKKCWTDTGDQCCQSLENKNFKKVKESIEKTISGVYIPKMKFLCDLTYKKPSLASQWAELMNLQNEFTLL